MSNLPFDIITNILSRLPVKPLLRFKCVSKRWYCLIKDPKFIQMHLSRSIEDQNFNIMLRHCSLSFLEYDSPFDEAKNIDYPFKTSEMGVEILGSCNGILLVNPDEDVYCLWNPSTQEFKKLPETPIEFPDTIFPVCRSICHGFGYDRSIDDYKVVRIVNFYGDTDDEFDTEVKVYTLGTNSWKRVDDVHYHILYKRVSGVLVNGALHWAATRKPESDLTKVIVAFDLVDEKFKEVPQPYYEADDFHMTLGVLGGRLTVHSNFYQVRMEIWVMKGYGVRDSWTKLFSISQPGVMGSFLYLMPLCYRKNDKVLLEKDNKDLVLYGLNSKKVKTLKICGIPDWFETEAYVGSLVTLNTGTYVRQYQAKGRTAKKKKSGKKRFDVAL